MNFEKKHFILADFEMASQTPLKKIKMAQNTLQSYFKKHLFFFNKNRKVLRSSSKINIFYECTVNIHKQVMIYKFFKWKKKIK